MILVSEDAALDIERLRNFLEIKKVRRPQVRRRPRSGPRFKRSTNSHIWARLEAEPASANSLFGTAPPPMSCATQFSPKTKIFWCSAFGTVAKPGHEQSRSANSARKESVAEKGAEFVEMGAEICVEVAE